MKNIFRVVLCCFIFVLLTGCRIPVFANITVENASDYDVENISLIYYHGTNGRQVERINILVAGQSKTISVERQCGRLGTFVTSVVIEYYINGIKFDVKNEKDSFADADGNVFTRARIGSGTRFTIRNEYYVVQNL